MSKTLGVVNYHARGNVIYGQCNNSKISKDTKIMYQVAQKQTGYGWTSSSNVEISGGQYREYVMYSLNVPSITIEIGSTFAPCPYWQYKTEFQKNRLVTLKIVDAL